MTEAYRLGIFDVDGTIRTKETGVPSEIREGFSHLWENNILTTIMTGRGLIRAREAIGADWNKFISPHMPVGMENGARITDNQGQQNIRFFPLHPSEITLSLELIATGGAQFVAYFPQNPSRKAVIWTPRNELITDLRIKYSHFADISGLSQIEIERRMAEDKPCMLAIKPDSFDFLDEYAKDANVFLNEGFINHLPQGVDKGTGVVEIADIVDVPLARVFAAGNEDNDLPMLKSPIALKLFVGHHPGGFLSIPNLEHFETVAELGKRLQKI